MFHASVCPCFRWSALEAVSPRLLAPAPSCSVREAVDQQLRRPLGKKPRLQGLHPNPPGCGFGENSVVVTFTVWTSHELFIGQRLSRPRVAFVGSAGKKAASFYCFASKNASRWLLGGFFPSSFSVFPLGAPLGFSIKSVRCAPIFNDLGLKKRNVIT